MASLEKSTLLRIFKDFSKIHTVTSIAKELKISRVGTWKILKRLEADKLITLSPIGKGKTSAVIAKINFENEVTDKYIALCLTEETSEQRRWQVNFKELKEKASFSILYGSILIDQKHANDIDIVTVVQDRTRFKKIHAIIDKVQHSQIKKIHAINFNEEEFRQELEKPNHAFVDAVKTGTLLFGQEKFIYFLKKLHAKK